MTLTVYLTLLSSRCAGEMHTPACALAAENMPDLSHARQQRSPGRGIFAAFCRRPRQARDAHQLDSCRKKLNTVERKCSATKGRRKMKGSLQLMWHPTGGFDEALVELERRIIGRECTHGFKVRLADDPG